MQTMAPDWSVGIAVVPDCGFQSVSFVNGISTQRGGTHVTAVADALVKKLVPYISKKVEGESGAVSGHTPAYTVCVVWCVFGPDVGPCGLVDWFCVQAL